MYGLTDYAAGIELAPRTPYVNGYLVNTNINAAQFLFLLPNHFDAKLGLLGENSKQPVTMGELLTLGSVPTTNAYPGPVYVITGYKSLTFPSHMARPGNIIVKQSPYS